MELATIPDEYSGKQIKFRKADDELCELYQPLGVEFALVDFNGNMVHQFVKCKDYLQDVYFGYHNNKNIEVYGFRWSHDVDPMPSIAAIRVLVKNNDNDTWENDLKMQSALELIHTFERLFFKNAKKRETWVRRIKAPTKDESDYYMFEGSSRWLQTPYFISLYTLLIRLGEYELPKMSWKDTANELKALTPPDDVRVVEENSDAAYAKTIIKIISKIIRHRHFLFGERAYTGWKMPHLHMNIFHNQSGVVSLCKGTTYDTYVNNQISGSLKYKK